MNKHKSQAEAGGIREHVEFTGHVSHEELPGLLRKADIYVSSSLFDGTSSSLLEAMATGLLPIVSRIDANTACLQEGRHSLMFAPGSSTELVTAIQRGMDDDTLRQRAFVENRQFVEREGNLSHNMKRLKALCHSVIEETR